MNNLIFYNCKMTAEMTEVKFAVIGFVKYIQDHEQQVYDILKQSRFLILGCDLYFEPNEAEFKGSKGKQIYIKPIAIKFNGTHYDSYTIGHHRVLELFGNSQPIITFRESDQRRINKKLPLQSLNVATFFSEKFGCNTYYRNYIDNSPCRHKEVIAKILNSKIES